MRGSSSNWTSTDSGVPFSREAWPVNDVNVIGRPSRAPRNERGDPGGSLYSVAGSSEYSFRPRNTEGADVPAKRHFTH